MAGACCEDDGPLQLENNESLVQATKVGSYTALELQALVAVSGYSIPGSLDYDVDIYKVIYNSTYKDNPILASGVVMMPVAQEAGMISVPARYHRP